MRTEPLGRLLLGLFILSGFSGLIYQSIWSHYLGLVLGHAAYAQALVLAIFMGGMALGAWLASRGSLHWRHLLLRYAVLELVVGVFGVGFHAIFQGYVSFSQDSILPVLGSPFAAHSYQWATAAVLILPQCVLLGMTFPLMSAAYLRMTSANDGQVLGGLYFSNSFGAALGALASVFLLLPAVGMPGAMFTAGLLNIVVALGAWAVWKTQPEANAPLSAKVEDAPIDRDPASLVRFLMICAFVTGATSFVYEIGWVRMLNMALGTTLHSFELMLAAFIMGLAFGGFRVRQRSAQIKDAARSAGWAQVWMGISALASVVLFAQSFQWVGWLMQALQRNDTGYDLFMGGSGLIALLVMFPAAFFAGMTLPLLTMALLRAGGSERRIGQVYASNTLGAIAGVALMVFGLIPLLGVQGAVVASALTDVALGVLLLARTGTAAMRTRAIVAATSMTIVALVATYWLGRLDPRVRVSGVYRSGKSELASEANVVFQRDGRTSTVAVVGASAGLTIISTNGKPDAGLTLDPSADPSPDEITMILAGVLPNLLHPRPNDVAVIGWGSGLTTHTLLGSSKPARVETIEIEPAMVEGARQFGGRVARAYDDARSKLHVDDARTYFAAGNRKFDVIVSEPSNPWVSGVASLFTQEFYRFLRGHLRRDGMLVQWIQAYELDGDLLATMLAALLEEFPNSELYLTNTADLLLVARTGPAAPADPSLFMREPLRSELARVHLRSPADVALRRIGGPDVLRAYVASKGAQPHSDFFPTVSLNAPRSRFKKSNALELLEILDTGMPVSELLDGYVIQPKEAVADDPVSLIASRKHASHALAQRLKGNTTAPPYKGSPKALAEMYALQTLSRGPVGEADLMDWTDYVADVASETLASLTPAELEGVWVRPSWIDPATQPRSVQDVMAALDAAARRDVGKMLPSALLVLEQPSNAMSGRLRDLMLTQAQVAALRLGRPDLVVYLERRHGPAAGRQSYSRRFLLAWAQVVAAPRKD